MINQGSSLKCNMDSPYDPTLLLGIDPEDRRQGLAETLTRHVHSRTTHSDQEVGTPAVHGLGRPHAEYYSALKSAAALTHCIEDEL